MTERSSHLSRVRLVGKLEGTSFLLLLGVAMPLKYLADLPMAVKVVGWAHGVLFMAFCFVLLRAFAAGSLSFRHGTLALVAALLPFGPFLIDGTLRDAAAGPDTESA